MLSLAGGRKEGREEGIGTKEGRKAGRKEGSCKTLARYPAQRPLQLSKEDSLGKLRDICFLVLPSYTTTNQPTVPWL